MIVTTIVERSHTLTIFEETRTMSDHCRTCGACCAHFQVRFPASEQVPQSLTLSRGRYRVMAGTNRSPVRCAALVGEVGKSAYCIIYDDRPSVCRVFAPGSSKCNQARAAHGLPPIEK